MMTKINRTNENEDKFNDDNIFKHFSNRLHVPFYGFLKENGKNIGFLCEFMCNGRLDSFISSRYQKVNQLFILTTIIRVIELIDYLHKNSINHFFIDASNIFVNHNEVVYISFFQVDSRHNKSNIQSLGQIIHALLRSESIPNSSIFSSIDSEK